MKLGVKISGGFGVMIIIILAMGAFALISGLNIANNASSIAQQHIPETVYQAKLNHIMANFVLEANNYAYHAKKENYDKAVALLKQLDKTIIEAKKFSNDKQFIKEIEEIEKATLGIDEKLLALKQAGKGKVSEEDLIKQCNSAILTISDYCVESLEHSNHAAVETHKSAISVFIVSLAAMIVSFIIGLSLAIYITRNIVKPMNKAVEVAEAVAAGDMSKRLELNRNDEIGILAKSLDNLPEAINRVLAEFNNTVEKIMHGYLNSRCDKTGFEGGYAELLENGNNLADAMGNYIETSSVPILIIDKEFNVCYANKAVADIAGSSVDKLFGSKCFESMRSGDCQTSNCAVGKAMSTGQTCSQETTATPGGKQLEILYTGVPIKNKAGEVVGAAEFVTDLTEIKLLLYQIADTADTLAASSEELSTVSSNLLSSSEEMSSQANNVSASTEQMSTNINAMASAAEEMNVNAQSVSSASEQMSQNMNNVASAIEEMSTSMNTIGDSAHQGVEVAGQAIRMSDSATETMNILGTAAKEIGQVTEVIKRIAQQTNLLALNATIEAASAGEAGKGFAVVANEIKELANQSAQAAEDITQKIEDVQSRTGESVDAINKVSGIIGKLNESVTLIGNLVEEQTQAANDISANVGEANIGVNNIASSIKEVATGTTEMSRNAGEAANGASDVSSNIGEVSTAAGDTSANASQVNASAGELAKLAGTLQEIINNSSFKIKRSGYKKMVSSKPE